MFAYLLIGKRMYMYVCNFSTYRCTLEMLQARLVLDHHNKTNIEKFSWFPVHIKVMLGDIIKMAA